MNDQDWGDLRGFEGSHDPQVRRMFLERILRELSAPERLLMLETILGEPNIFTELDPADCAQFAGLFLRHSTLDDALFQQAEGQVAAPYICTCPVCGEDALQGFERVVVRHGEGVAMVETGRHTIPHGGVSDRYVGPTFMTCQSCSRRIRLSNQSTISDSDLGLEQVSLEDALLQLGYIRGENGTLVQFGEEE